MEYDAAGGITPIQGAFYCTAARKSSPFNCFREENRGSLPIAPFISNYDYKPVDPTVEKKILSHLSLRVDLYFQILVQLTSTQSISL